MTWTPRIIPSARRKYLGIADAIAADIRSGVLRAGDRLPPQREIAHSLSVDLTTVTRALNEARKRNLVEATVGKGTFVRLDQPVDRHEAQELPSPVFDLSMNAPPQPAEAELGKRIFSAIANTLSEPNALMRLSYQENIGTRRDRLAGAEWLRPRLGTIPVERMVVTGGAQSALYALAKSLFKRGDVLCAGTLCYPGFKAAAADCGLNLLPLPMDGHGIIPDALEEACKRSTVRGVYLVPTIDNPTTATLPDQRRKQIVEIAQRYSLEIVEDDAYADLADTPLPPLASYAPDRTWHIATLSKSVTPALRIAYVACPNTVHALQLSAVLRITNPMAPPLMSALATGWIADGSLDAIRSALRKENRERQQIAASILGHSTFAAHPCGHHIWLSLPQQWHASSFTEIANRSGLAVVASDAFDISGKPENAVRVSLGPASSQSILKEQLNLLSTLLTRPPFASGTVV
ncbi:MAG: PLP-dependent aminotransferase family protein [Phyllobacterium sp.]